MRLRIGVLATATLLLVAGCSTTVDGRAVIAVPRPGTPVQWAPCQLEGGAESRVPKGAECGLLSVPVDYDKPDGDVARIALIRFPATGDKIGSLVINPGGPGESGVEAVGDEKLTYLGYSYGTRIGSTYAENYPDKVRAMVLDGAVDPNADPVEANVRQAKAFQTAFDDYAADCAATEPECPLGDDPAKANDVYHSLVDPLVEEPAETRDPRGLSYSDAIVGTILPLYSPNLWRHLTQALSELKDGTGDTMLALADLYMGRDQNGQYNNSTDARVAVNCVDKPAVTDRDKVVEEDRRVREAAPFLSYGEFTGHAPLSTCAFWPVPPTSEPHEIEVSGLPPVLVVSTTNDPATPYQAGEELAKQLGGTMLTFEGTQHTVVFQGDKCVDDIAARYLIDLSVPPEGARCP